MTLHMEEQDMSSRKLFRLSILLIAGLTLSGYVGAQISYDGPANDHFTADPGVLPPFSHPFGLSYGDWSARWWQWTYSLPTDQHPLFDTADCSEGQTGKVWFLGGTFTTNPDPEDPTVVIGEAVRECSIPVGKALFFPIVNADCNTVDDSTATEAELRACANFLADHIQNLLVTIDGITVDHIELYRTESPLFTIGPFPDNNILGTEPGTTADSVTDGFYVMLAPLSRGQHEIHFEGAAIFTVEEDGFDFTFMLDITYYLTVGRGGARASMVEREPAASAGGGVHLDPR